jgi:hypothetical protein
MAGVFAKLNLREQREVLVLDAPPSFEKELERLQGVRVRRDLAAVRQVSFALVFVTQQAQLDRWSKVLAAKAAGDAVLWFAYPKATSQKLACEFNRDRGWDAIRTAGFDSVRQVAIDADWSALRFRRLEFINRRA